MTMITSFFMRGARTDGGVMTQIIHSFKNGIIMQMFPLISLTSTALKRR
jgi:hypothetical protein